VRRNQRQADDAPGQDSFLDIVANIVGILIILIMVVGVRAKDAWVRAATTEPTVDAQEEIDVDSPAEAAAAVESDIHQMTNKMRTMRRQIAENFHRREQLQLLVLAAEQTLKKWQGRLDDSARERYEVDRRLASARDELARLQQDRRRIEQTPEQVEVIDHLPTPMAKTVFGKEEHFRLLRGRLCYVPMNELTDVFQREARQKIWKLKSTPQITETIGPLGGFRMKYTLKREVISAETQMGPVQRQVIQLSQFILVPVADDLGEPLEAALRPGSEFRRRLAGLDPEVTTITVWVYPEGFERFRTLRDQLYEMGFLTAGRPLPAGQPISGGPDGTRSAAQ